MLILGITGGVGSGKSKILYDLSNLYGAYIVETDKLAHTLMEPGQTVYQAVVEAFGTEILQAEEPYAIDRAKFAQIVFADKEKLAQLNALTHPAVKTWIRKDIEEKRKQDVKIYVIEAALLIQDGYKEICDEIWYIYVDEETRIKRLMKQRGYTEEMNGSMQTFSRLLTDNQNQASEAQLRQLTNLENRFKTLESTNNEKLESMRLTMMRQLTSIQEENQKKLDVIQNTVNEKLETQLQKSFKLVSERYMEPLNNGDIASALGYHPNYVNSVFVRDMGMSLHQYLMRYRVEMAMQLLLTTQLPVSDIAVKVGFRHFSHFSNCFHRLTGVAPAAYRLER